MRNIKYFIIPENIEDGNRIIEKFYNQLCLISLLLDTHHFIPPVVFKKMALKDLIGKQTFPLKVSEEEVTLLSMYLEEEVKDIAWQESRRVFPIPYFKKDDTIKEYMDIAGNLYKDSNWVKQVVDFFVFLSENNYLISEDISPEDFLYRSEGTIKYFIGFNKLKYSKKSDGQFVESGNLKALALLLNRFYIQDTERFDARLYQQSWFEKIEGRLIEPLLYDKYSAVCYSNFTEFKEDLAGNIMVSLPKRNIGVFLDVANLLTPMYIRYSIMKIDFNKLFNSIYGSKDTRNIIKKVAVIFLPVYQGDIFRANKYNLLFDIKDYLESYGFEVLTVENQTAAAKIDIDGRLIDTDDLKLINVMQYSMKTLDSVLLLTGDRHFADIARIYLDSGKEIRVISVSEENTSKIMVEEFDHNYIYEYPDCIYFV
ncbi:MAG: NYN domain-containing protein [Halanaerobiales bacterium]